MAQPDHPKPETFNDFLRGVFKKLLDKVATLFDRLGITPNMITVAGFLGHLIASVLIARGYLLWGGLLVIIVAPLDAIDGVLARLRQETSRFGGFIDSVVDRYSEIVLFAGLLIYFLEKGQNAHIIVLFIAAVGSLMVSYIRARAESLNYSAKIGIMARVERYLVLIPGIIFGYPQVSLWILAILTNFTAIQRWWHVRKQARKGNENL